MALVIGSAHSLAVDSTRVSAFYAAHWQRRIALVQEDFYTWQFKSLPLAKGIDNCVLAYDPKAGRIAGVMGLNSRPFYLSGQAVNGAELTSWVVDEEYRGSGTGAKILSHVVSTYDVLVGFGVSAMALPLYLRSGFRYLAAVPRFVRIYDPDIVASIGKVDPLARKLAREWHDAFPAVPHSVAEVSVQEVDSLFGRLVAAFNLLARDAVHLSWRYTQHPTFKYRQFIVRPAAGSATALVVLREETCVPGITICHVTDCIGDDAAMAAAFSFIDAYCREAGVHVADFYCTATKINKYPLSRGWFSTVDDSCLMFPHLFRPVEIRTPATTSMIYWAKREFTEMCDFSRLYITKADADFDRPTLG